MPIDPRVTTDPLLNAAYRSVVFDWMAAHGVAVIRARFDGSGDSGSFDAAPDIDIDVAEVPEGAGAGMRKPGGPDAYHAAYHSMIEAPAVPMRMLGGDGVAVTADLSIADLVLALSEHIEATTEHGVDWWNNDGGEGCVEWIVDGEGADGNHYRRGICLTVSQRVIELNTSFHAVAGLDGDEPGQEDAS